MLQIAWNQQEIETTLAREYPRLVGLCAHITGDASIAEDLAQETFVEAWRNLYKLRDLDGLSPWLSAIARNVCLRWRSNRGRIAAHMAATTTGSASTPDSLDWLASDEDIELELERDDLADLLDQALALLPPETRAVLLEHYVAGQPIAAIGTRFGMSVGAVKMRLRRGRIAVRHALNGELRPGAAAFGLVERDTDWHETSIWCPICGRRTLDGFYDRAQGDLALRCPECYPAYGLFQSQTYAMPELFGGIESIADAYEHLMREASQYFRQALDADAATCLHCGQPATPVRMFPPGSRLSTVDWLGVHVHCRSCDRTTSGSISGMLLGLPELQSFRQEHPRLRTLPQRQIETDGRQTVVVRFQSVASGDIRTVRVDRERFDILSVHDERPVPSSA